MTICVRCVVSGRVQGVFFRASTREQALKLGIQGHALNLADGRVEVLACGPPEAIDQLRQWLSKGPPAARVTAVTCEVVSEPSLSGFATG
ncbi:MAG TPA: acylphosphatase [Sedimenticola sp.]|nr:acylphosphatase [Sedimenticola sp.]